jgi:hypothetical protein
VFDLPVMKLCMASGGQAANGACEINLPTKSGKCSEVHVSQGYSTVCLSPAPCEVRRCLLIKPTSVTHLCMDKSQTHVWVFIDNLIQFSFSPLHAQAYCCLESLENDFVFRP